MSNCESRRALTVVVVAAGEGRRMGGVSKVWRPLEGRPTWWWSLAPFCGQVAAMVVVLHPDRVEDGTGLVDPSAVTLVAGGDTRAASVLAGLAEVSTPFVAVHDGARPLVSPQLVARVWRAAAEVGAAIPALGATDTVKMVRGGRVVRTLPRAHVALAQTPQIFRAEWLRQALAAGMEETDDSAAVEALGHAVAVVDGEPTNRKLTVEEDWAWLQRTWTDLRSAREAPAWDGWRRWQASRR